MSTMAPPTHLRATPMGGVCAAALVVIAMIIWQGVTAHGAPDPTRLNTSPTAAFLDIGVLVFREGLECILVLAAITASMTGSKTALSASRCLGHRHRFCRDINHVVYRGANRWPA